MKKLILTIGLVAAFTGCQEDAVSSTFKITESNALSAFKGALNAGNYVTESYSSIPSPQISSMRAATTVENTVDCLLSGHTTTSLTFDDSLFTGQTLPTNGEIKASVQQSQCNDGMIISNGGATTSFAWQGHYNGDFENMNIAIDVNNLSVTDSKGIYSIHGNLSLVMDTENVAVNLDIRTSSPELNGESINLKTTSAIQSTLYSDTATSGTFRIDGAEGTYATATIVPNGWEVSVNGGQAKLYSWSEFGMQ